MHQCKPLASGRDGCHHGRPVQVDPIKPTLKAPGIKLLKLASDKLLSKCPFKFNLRRYTMEREAARRQGPTLVHVRAQLERLQDTVMS